MRTNHGLLIALVLLSALLFNNCAPRIRVGELQSESQSVDLGDAQSVRVEINLGAGELDLTGGTEKLLEADFTYNVANLQPEVEYTDSTLVVRQPEFKGMPALQGIEGFRNEWNLRLNDDVPMDLRLDIGAGTSDLQLASLSLTRLEINLGAGASTVDLSNSWARDLDVTIDAGAGDISLRLPEDVGVRVEVRTGLGTINASGLIKDGEIYTNAAFGVSDVTLRVNVEAGIGQINLELD
jgi:hypothetical protein